MKQIEIIRLSVHLNLFLAKMNMQENKHDLAISKLQDARRLLEKLGTLMNENDKSTFH